MGNVIVTSVVWVCALGCGLIAGLYFAFSTFIMTALQRVGPVAGTQVMNSINVVILKSLFMPVFYVTTLGSAALAIVALFRWGESGMLALLLAGLIYFVGMFICTLAFNVPLNDLLAAANPGTQEGETVWKHYLVEWTFWNHVRTVASLLATALFIYVIKVRLGGPPL